MHSVVKALQSSGVPVHLKSKRQPASFLQYASLLQLEPLEEGVPEHCDLLDCHEHPD